MHTNLYFDEMTQTIYWIDENGNLLGAQTDGDDMFYIDEVFECELGNQEIFMYKSKEHTYGENNTRIYNILKEASYGTN